MADANANPERRFFIDLITRDISLEDAIMDFVDNAIDSLVRTRGIDLYEDFLQDRSRRVDQMAEIKIAFSTRRFTVEDNCGGISFETAENDIFRFGHPDPRTGPYLSVFGIGMKRAIFKIGRKISIESRASESGFSMPQPLLADEWMKDADVDWKIPIERTMGATEAAERGTRIVIERLKDEVSTRITDPGFEDGLIRRIQVSYPFYLGKYVRIRVNKQEVQGEDLTFAEADYAKPTIEKWQDGRVDILLICGFLPRDKWTVQKSGWYIVCNGRIIVYADRQELTGWGWKGLLPLFMPKNRGFAGIVFFRSAAPEELPWNTMKHGINTESPVYIRTLKKMVMAARPVIEKQNKMYEGSDSDEPRTEYRESVKTLQTVSATKQVAEKSQSDEPRSQPFFFNPPQPQVRMTSIQFKVKVEDVERVRKRLGRSSMSNTQIGEYVFKYFLDRECPQG